MYSNYDLDSVRSMPVLSKVDSLLSFSRSRGSINSPFLEASRSSIERRVKVKESWKERILPEVMQKYQYIVSQGFQWNTHPKKERSILNAEDTPIKRYELDQKKPNLSRVRLQDKIKSLEEQNLNLRQELYYLREALLLNFQAREQQ